MNRGSCFKWQRLVKHRFDAIIKYGSDCIIKLINSRLWRVCSLGLFDGSPSYILAAIIVLAMAEM